MLIGIDRTATLVGPALGGVLLLTGPTRMLVCLSVLSFLSAALALRTPSTPCAPRATANRDRAACGKGGRPCAPCRPWAGS
ncbi:hypothetical protein [Streptomyces sp. NPDC003697]